MEAFNAHTGISPETTEKQPVTVHPLVKASLEIATGIGRAFADEVLAPEMSHTSQQEPAGVHFDYSQQELLEALLVQSQIDILNVQRPSTVMARLFTPDTRIQQDAANITTIRHELQQMTHKQTVTIEPQEFVQQQAMHVASAISTSS